MNTSYHESRYDKSHVLTLLWTWRKQLDDKYINNIFLVHLAIFYAIFILAQNLNLSSLRNLSTLSKLPRQTSSPSSATSHPHTTPTSSAGERCWEASCLHWNWCCSGWWRRTVLGFISTWALRTLYRLAYITTHMTEVTGSSNESHLQKFRNLDVLSMQRTPLWL